MITSTKTDWKTSEAILTSLRTDVFIVEQGISLHDEWDDKDKHAQHYLAHKNTLTVGCARLVFDHTQGKIGRVAILQAYRRQKIASHLLQFIIADAIKMGLTVLTLDAQIQVTQLYEAFGFISQGDIFLDAGIPHQRMCLSLKESI